MAGAGGEFVEGWLVAQLLGEGAYGEVRLLVHARSGARVALKGVRGAAGAREAALHRALRHAHVLRCLGARAHLGRHYLFLEYAPGGELFERIAPDAGMAPAHARRYWRQLAAGLRYLHARGVAHRDLKPENLLLDARDRIKISDFGMATLYRHGARERLMGRVCGTLPYAAPEVLEAEARPYRAPPADVWAAAVVLLAMLVGELPWERATESEPRYAAWSAWAGAGEAAGPPPPGAWRRVAPAALRWLRRALQPAPERRARLADLLLDRWMHDAPPPAAGGARACLSQPASAVGADDDDEAGGADDLSPADMDALLSSSQPAPGAELLPASSGPEAGGARRLAGRVWLAGGEAGALRALAAALRAARWPWRRLQARTLAVECGAELRMRVVVAGGARDAALVHFQRWRGCGLQYQRCVLQLRAALRDHEVPPPEPQAAPAPPEPMDEDRD
ncbi:serine/threonine-protein kinase Chk1 [Pectinophora gossypiella]|uniref:serine/threonine-protein kinase Chk1 n=1 Tax=Pectinophora gossypiella TaxID=13191 RepID=UPI00214F4503|nr:serine/threonine-protein kinase Chk1 [Pectinophora gossypiella]